MTSDSHYRLYGGEISYYSGKVRAYLGHKGIPFEEYPATREIYKEIILPRVGWPVIPVVVTPEGETLQDSTEIIDALEQRFPEPSVYPEGSSQKLAALLLEVYGDEWLKIPAMHYRWNHNSAWIIREFGRLSRPDATPAEQDEIGERTCRPFRGSLPALGVSDMTIPAIEASYESLLRDLDVHLKHNPFLLGNRPSMADFGLIGPLYAHQYRDPASGALMERIAPSVVAWVKRMMKPRAAEAAGEFVPNDLIPSTLLPILARMAAEQFPVLAATRTAFEAWNQLHPDETIPRGIGLHGYTLERNTPREAHGERSIFPFDLWMLQRPQDHYQSLDDSNRRAADALMASIGGDIALLADRPATRLTRVAFRLARS